MDTNPTQHTNLVASLTVANAAARQYSEADISVLENADLTREAVSVALRSAYAQNDPNETDFVGFRRNADEGIGWTTEALTSDLEHADAVLRTKPKDYWWRCRRLAIREHIALLRQRDGEDEANPREGLRQVR